MIVIVLLAVVIVGMLVSMLCYCRHKRKTAGQQFSSHSVRPLEMQANSQFSRDPSRLHTRESSTIPSVLSTDYQDMNTPTIKNADNNGNRNGDGVGVRSGDAEENKNQQPQADVLGAGHV
uniref:Uncharacterized protein n=3 Tax=Lotharella globosa TaxID=91324 RepID=A0A7S4DNJ8_9EUKA|mmetsp:Transcript_16967/g.32197  ORF Transcript_16967/g.32197 Transcript_16967/m.32197 type:complete len:120 (+) Transcript_16967:160-519(+)